MGSVSTSIRGVRFTLYIPDGNECVRFPRHSVSGSILLGLTWDSWCGKGTAPGCAWCLRGAMLLRGFRLFGVALHREPKGTKRRNIPVVLHCTGMECVEGVPSGQICQSQAFDHSSHTVVDCGYDPASACKATTSHVGHCSSSDLPVLSPTRQIVVFASLFSTVRDGTRSRWD